MCCQVVRENEIKMLNELEKIVKQKQKENDIKNMIIGNEIVWLKRKIEIDKCRKNTEAAIKNGTEKNAIRKLAMLRKI